MQLHSLLKTAALSKTFYRIQNLLNNTCVANSRLAMIRIYFQYIYIQLITSFQNLYVFVHFIFIPDIKNLHRKKSIFMRSSSFTCVQTTRTNMDSRYQDKWMFLKVTAATWTKKIQNSLYDHEAPTKDISITKEELIITKKTIKFYRKKQYSLKQAKWFYSDSSEIKIVDSLQSTHNLKDYELIAQCQLNPLQTFAVQIKVITPSTYKQKDQQAKKQKPSALQTGKSKPIQDAYFLVRQNQPLKKDKNVKLNMWIGSFSKHLVPGMKVKLGKMQFFVRQYFDGITKLTADKQCCWKKTTFKYQKQEGIKHPCKICYVDAVDDENYIFNPCKCKGASGATHFECLEKWVNVKIKETVIGGTQHYNYTKLQCQVCKASLPEFIDFTAKSGKVPNVKELITIDRPSQPYLILEGAWKEQRTVIVFRNIPVSGISLGRGHVADIKFAVGNISRSQSVMYMKEKKFFISDMASRYGTLVSEPNMVFRMDKYNCKQCIQIGKTIIQFQLDV